MNTLEVIEEAFITLKVNKLRTALAILGIVIGIGSVIALVSFGQASQKSVTNQIESLGSNLLTISPGFTQSGNVRGAAGGGTTLTYDDAKAIMNSPKITSVSKVSPEVSKRSQVVTGQNNTNTQIYGVTPEYFEVKKVEISLGSSLTESQINSMSKVAVVGPQVVEDLFGDSTKNVVGELIRIENQSFKIIGVTKEKGGSGMNNQDDMVFVPLTTAMKILYGQTYLSSISVEAKSEDVMVKAQAIIY